MQANFNKLPYISLIFSLLLLVFTGCSTKKNTSFSRFYHATNTRFNVFFNGSVSYNEGITNIFIANKDDYSSVIPMFPISHHTNAAAATSNMDRAIEKCRKAMKLHSIKTKPEKNYKKSNQPDYILFYNQKEFNPAIKDAWMLLAKSEFHKGDFLGSVGSFLYIAKLYDTDKDLVAQCQLWISRAYVEMGWMYEAEQVLAKINQDDLNRASVGLYAAVNADLLIKKHAYNEAIPFLELTLSKEKDKKMKQRFRFILGQLYQKTDNKKAAIESYSAVIKSNPPYEMDFNARINRAQLSIENIDKVRKELNSMIKNKNNKEYLDQLYYALGNTYLTKNDTIKAIENYKLSVEKSTRKSLDQAVSYITLGDLYYSKKKYTLAQPCYDNACKIITKEQDDFVRVSRRAETLSELMVHDNVVQLQDSLQRLSAMTETQRLQVVNRLIENLIKEEKLAAEKAKEDEILAAQNSQDEYAGLTPIGGSPLNSNGDWYFYNPMLVRNGQTEFKKKWGQRKLEDNWRRVTKTTSLFSEESTMSTNAATSTPNSDSLQSNSESLSDNKKPAFYLKQIPVTSAQIAKSNADIADALYAMGFIYKEKIEDDPMAITTFYSFINRFNTDKRVPEVYYQLYLLNAKINNTNEASLYRSNLINNYPTSKYAEMLSQPDFVSRLQNMHNKQDSIYALTYQAYLNNDFSTVFTNVEYIKLNFPLSDLMPNFLFLHALCVGKKETPEKFEVALNNLIKQFPESEVSAMSKDMLALMKQGREVKTGTTSGSLLAMRDKETLTDGTTLNQSKQFSAEKQTKHRLLLVTSANQQNMNKMLFNVASFNFSRFMIKDFDLVITKIDSMRNALIVTNLESFDEALWYQTSLNTDTLLTRQFVDNSVQQIVISEENYALLRTVFSLNDYILYSQKNIKSEQSKMQVVTTTKSKLPPTGIAVQTTPTEIKSKNQGVVKPNNQSDTKSVITNVSTTSSSQNKSDKNNDKVVSDYKGENKIVEEQKVSAEIKKEVVSSEKKIENQNQTIANNVVVPPASTQTKLPVVPLFKNLYAYRADEPHFVALYVSSGTLDFTKLKAELDAYNAKNYALLNLKVSLENYGKQQVVIIGSLIDASSAKSYLMRFVKEKNQFEGLKNANCRNLLGSQSNLSVMMQQNAMNVYFEFMQEYYLK